MDLPTVSLTTFLSHPDSPEATAEARRAAESLIINGAVVVADDRAPKAANDRFLDLFEDYFSLGDDVLGADERPQYGYQVVSPLCLCDTRQGNPNLIRPGRHAREYRKAQMLK